MKIKIDKIMDKLQFIQGFVMPANILMLKIGASEIAVLNIVLLVMYVLYFGKKKIRISKKNIALYMLSAMFIISYIININSLEGAWLINSKQAMLKLGLFLLPLTLFIGTHNCDEFIKGLKYGCFCQLIWGAVQFGLYEMFGISLNEIVFGGMYANVSDSMLTKINNGHIRLTGLSYEPANFSLVLNVGYVLSSNIYVKILYILVMLVSTSRTGLVVMISVMVLDYILFIRKKKQLNRNFIFMIIFVFIAGLIISICNIDAVKNGLNNMLLRLTNSSSNSRHLEYYQVLPQIWEHENVLEILFGTGTAATGIPYTEFFGIYTWLNYWCPESDFIFMIIGNGIVGAGIYYYILTKILVVLRGNRKLFLIAWAILLGGVGYIYIRSIWSLILIYYMYTKTYCVEKNLERGECADASGQLESRNYSCQL